MGDPREASANEEHRESETDRVDALTPEDLADLRSRAAKSNEYLELLKRSRADFANFQKRVDEDRKRWAAQAAREILAGLLAPAEQCRLAAEKSSASDSAESLKGAIDLVWSEMAKFIDASGVRAIRTEGEEFDPQKHRAVHVEQRGDLPDATVLQEIERGYEFNDHVLRVAQVVVSKRPRPPEPVTPAAAAVDGDEGGGGWNGPEGAR